MHFQCATLLRGWVNIHHYFPTLRWLIIGYFLVNTFTFLTQPQLRPCCWWKPSLERQTLQGANDNLNTVMSLKGGKSRVTKLPFSVLGENLIGWWEELSFLDNQMKSSISLGTHMQIVKDGLHIFSAYLFVRHAVQLFHPLKP